MNKVKHLFLPPLIVALAIFAGGLCAAADEEDGPDAPRQVTLAVFGFEASGSAAGAGRAVADMLITNLAQKPLFRVYERARLDEVIREQQMSGGHREGDPRLKAAETLGVQFVLMGKVTEFGVSDNSVLIPMKGTVTKYKARAALDVRLVQVSDAQVIRTWTAVGSKSDYNLGVNILGIPNFSFTGKQFDDSLLGKATRKAVDDVAAQIEATFRDAEMQELAKSLPVQGRVADVEGGALVLNAGSTAGVAPGMAMDIFRLIKEIKDPETGEVLTERLEHIGELLVTHVEENFSEAKVLNLEENFAVKVNDRVREQIEKEETRKFYEMEEAD